MIVCSCNVLSDRDVRAAIAASHETQRVSQIYGCFACVPACGRCAGTIKRIIDARRCGDD
jgi:bacterioferritin-associated ferredoxin